MSELIVGTPLHPLRTDCVSEAMRDLPGGCKRGQRGIEPSREWVIRGECKSTLERGFHLLGIIYGCLGVTFPLTARRKLPHAS